MKKALRTIGLIAILTGPFLLFFLLSKGSHEFQKLPLLFSGNASGKPPQYDSLTFTSAEGRQLTLNSFKDKILIVTCFSPGCPQHCPVDAQMMRFSLYTPLIETRGFNDVVLISECEGSDSAAYTMQRTLEVEEGRWFFVTMPKGKSFFDVKLNPNNPYQMKDPGNKKLMAHQRSILLIDKEKRIRGFYNAARSIEFKRIMQELRLLKKQYAKEKEKLKEKKEK